MKPRENSVNVFAASYAKGMEEIQKGNFAQALVYMKAALHQQPQHLDALYNLARLYEELGQLDDALAQYNACLEAQSQWPAVWNNRGNVLRLKGLLTEALSSYRRCIEIDPNVTGFVLPNMAQVQYAVGDFEISIRSYEQALSIQPQQPEAWNGLGVVYAAVGRCEDASRAFEHAVKLAPTYAEAWGNLGSVLQKQGQHEVAGQATERALHLAPQHPNLWRQAGDVWREVRRFADAKEAYAKSLALQPEQLDVVLALAHVSYEMLDMQAANAYLNSWLSKHPDDVAALWAQAVLSVSPVLMSQDQAISESEKLKHSLAVLNDAQRLRPDARWMEHAVPKTLFYLAYQERSHQDVLTQFADAAIQAMSAVQPEPSSATSHTTKLKVGVVSEFIYAHSVWEALVKGWVEHLDRDQFELHVFHLGQKTDVQTAYAKSQVHTFVTCAKNVSDCATDIAKRGMDVLIYPDVGMSARAFKLASLRLAPTQWATWGHPETTGLRTIDAFLSADALEPDDAQNHYTEKLIRLPNLGCAVSSISIPTTEAHSFEDLLDGSGPVLVCGGTPFKYNAKFDAVLVQITKAHPQARFVLFEYTANPYYSDALKTRLQQAFERGGMDASQYLKWITWLPSEAFLSLLKQADAFLDGFGFSGFNTALQALACDLPVVTYEGKFLRGRLGSGLLRYLDLNELVARSEADYLCIVDRLITDLAWREKLKQKMASALPRALNDVAPIRAMEQHLLAACQVNSK